MKIPQEDELAKRQERALDVYRPSGAIMVPEYLERHQEVVAVNADDLNDILGFDGMAAFFGGLGMFLLSGSVWLLVDKITSQPEFAVTMAIGTCSIAAISGLGFLVGGIYMHHLKRGRIKRIFSQTRRMG